MMLTQLKLVWSNLRHYPGMIKVSAGIVGMVLLTSHLGWLQVLEFNALDLLIRLRPEAAVDERIVILKIEEADISALGQWPLSDEKLARLLTQVQAQGPRIVGLDLYRDLPVPPGQDQLTARLQAMPNLIGVEKAVGQHVAAPPQLAAQGQVALADLVLDPDNKVRRGLVSIQSASGELSLSLGASLALSYLAQEGITPQMSDRHPDQVRIGKARLQSLQPNSGLYRNVDTGGYQILLQYRGADNFQSFPLRDVWEGRLPPHALRDKIVFIGATAPSLNDLFLTPYNTGFSQQSESMPGVYIHATLARQLLDGAMLGLPLIRDWPDGGEGLWIGIWAIAGSGLSWFILQSSSLHRGLHPAWVVLGSSVGLGILLSAAGYGLFLAGWWVPIATPLLALGLSAIAMVAYHNQILEGLATLDGLTQVANRRQFDRVLEATLAQPRPTALILCDVDYFKPFNDTYGHQAGDDCLVRVASAVRQAVRRTDLVARYGGEEFAVILPNTEPELAQAIAERVRERVSQLQIEHSGSKTAPHVTLSCGVSSASAQAVREPERLIEWADKALYLAKHQGRNSVVLKRAEGTSA